VGDAWGKYQPWEGIRPIRSKLEQSSTGGKIKIFNVPALTTGSNVLVTITKGKRARRDGRFWGGRRGWGFGSYSPGYTGFKVGN